MPATLKTIGCSAFSGCSSLREIKLPDGLQEIMLNCFGQSGIERLKIPSKIAVIPNMLCGGCKNLKEVELSQNTMKIEEYAFAYCESLIEISLPEKLMTIEGMAFCNCSSLKKVVFPKKHIGIDQNAFSGCIYNHRTTKTNQKYPSVNL